MLVCKQIVQNQHDCRTLQGDILCNYFLVTRGEETLSGGGGGGGEEMLSAKDPRNCNWLGVDLGWMASAKINCKTLKSTCKRSEKLQRSSWAQIKVIKVSSKTAELKHKNSIICLYHDIVVKRSYLRKHIIKYEWAGSPRRATCPHKPQEHSSSRVLPPNFIFFNSVKQYLGWQQCKVECRSQGHRSGRGCGLCQAPALRLTYCFLH